MKKNIYKLMIIMLVIIALPAQVFAATNGGGTGSGSITTNPLTSANVDIYGDNHFTTDVNGSFGISVNAASSVKKAPANSGGAAITIAQICNLDRIVYQYTITGVDNKNTLPGSSGVLTKHSGNKWYDSSCYITNLKPGLYRIQVKFTASYSGISKAYTISDSATFSVSQGPYGPRITVTANPNPGEVGKTINLSLSKVDVDKSVNPNNKIVSYTWKCLNSLYPQIVSSGKTATFTTAVPYGDYQVRCTVKDAQGNTGYDDVSINVRSGGPDIKLWAQSPLVVGETGTVTLSVDPKGLNLTYIWGEAFTNLDGKTYGSFGNAVSFNKPTASKTGTFQSTEPGQYKIAYTGTDKATGQNYTAWAEIQVVGQIQAAIKCSSTVSAGTTCKATDISTIASPMTFAPAKWSVREPDGTIKTYTTAPYGTISINTDKVGTHMITLTVTSKDNPNLKSTISKSVKVVEGSIVPEEEVLVPGNLSDLIDFTQVEIPDAAGAKKHKVAYSNRGLTGSCKDTATRVNHVGEINDAFQYWKLTVQLAEYEGNTPKITMIKKDEVVANGNSTSIEVTFPKEGIYQVYASKWWYCEVQGMKTHKVACTHTPAHSGPHTHCRFLQYQGGAVIEKHGEIGPYKVVITPDQVGKPIKFDDNWTQEQVKTESYLID